MKTRALERRDVLEGRGGGIRSGVGERGKSVGWGGGGVLAGDWSWREVCSAFFY